MEKILAAIREEVNSELDKEQISWPKVKNLVEMAVQISVMGNELTMDSIENAGTGMLGSQRVGIARPVPYVPSNMERLTGEILPRAIDYFAKKTANDVNSHIIELAGIIEKSKHLDNDIMSGIKDRLRNLLKEAKDEDLHPEHAGGHTTGQ